MKFALFLCLALLTTGCSSFRLGGVAYCPANHACQFTVQK